jgi:hypothetical protein
VGFEVTLFVEKDEARWRSHTRPTMCDFSERFAACAHCRCRREIRFWLREFLPNTLTNLHRAEIPHGVPKSRESCER